MILHNFKMVDRTFKTLDNLLVTTAEVEKSSKAMLHVLHLMDESTNVVQQIGTRTFASVATISEDVAKSHFMEDGSLPSTSCRLELGRRYSILPNIRARLAL